MNPAGRSSARGRAGFLRSVGCDTFERMWVRSFFVCAATFSVLLVGCGSSFTAGGGSSGGGSSGGGEATGGLSGTGTTGGSSDATNGGAAESGSAGMPEAGSNSAACSDPASDCAPTGTRCAEAVCDGDRCATANAPALTACEDNGGSLCLAGKCVECVKATDCPMPATACKVRACEPASRTCITVNRAVGVDCRENGGVVCDVTGTCNASHCADHVQDADETDVDCGGSCTQKCRDTAPQQKCKVNGDCSSGICSGSPLVCQPLSACAASCAGACQSCAIPGQVDTCAALPPGVDDTAKFCTGLAVCDGTGACLGSQNKGHFGDVCTQNADCFNDSCGAGSCRLRLGDACAEDAACKSGRCSSHVCAACLDAGDCASGKCNAGVCLFPGGYPCAAATDCAGALCAFGTKTCAAAGGEACTPDSCFTHFCKNGNCQTCSTSADCPLGTPCTGGSCRAPAGAYCTSATMCASGRCSASGLLSMRKCE